MANLVNRGMSIENTKLLIKKGAQVDVTGYSEGTPLQLAKQLFSPEQYDDIVETIKATKKYSVCNI